MPFIESNGIHTSSWESARRDLEATDHPEPIAIVGLGCRLPGGISTPSELWDFLCEERAGFREFGPDRINLDGFYHPNHQRPGSIATRGAYLLDEDPTLFDHTFFGMKPAEVLTLDPTQRKLLEVAYEAFENAGEPWERFSGSRTGVFIGNMNTEHATMQMYDADFALPYSPTGGSSSIISNRLNHVFNLKGPSMTIDTACSSSMYALHLAVNAIRNGDCDAAIVGGSNLISRPEMQLLTSKLGALSPTSTCHTFDSSADGYGRGEGFGALYLKRLSDAVEGQYPIRALVRGTAINSNGRTAGISHPSVEGQEALIRQAYRSAGLSTRYTAYFECHGTGTQVGDPVEVSAIGRVFAADREDSPLLIGSVKTNMGHGESASGVIGVMKTILAMENGMIPATIGVKNPNPSINFSEARVRVVTQMTPWPENLPRRASVNSFGYGGANGHCILEHMPMVASEFPDLLSRNRLVRLTKSAEAKMQTFIPSMSEGAGRRVQPRRLVLLPFSAHDEYSLNANISAIKEALGRGQCSLLDLAFTLSERRSKFLHRTFRVVDTMDPAKALSDSKAPGAKSSGAQPTRVGFVFTGQGAQWQGMGSSLFEYLVFRDSIAYQVSVLQSLSFSPPWNIEDILRGKSDLSVQEPDISQTVCTALQIALVDLLRSWSIIPHVVVGHSSGEIAAAYAAGHLSAAEAVTNAYCRGRALRKNQLCGRMLAVGLSADSAAVYLSEVRNEVKIAAVNSPESVTLSGNADQIVKLQERFKEDQVFNRMLHTNGMAYHSGHMLPVGAEYESLLRLAQEQLGVPGNMFTAENQKGHTRWISSVTPDNNVFGRQPTSDPTYWRRNLESTVQFNHAVDVLVANDASYADILLEIGPHSALQGPLKQIFERSSAETQRIVPAYLPSLKRFEDGMQNLLDMCGSLFCMNSAVDLNTVGALDILENNDHRYVYGSVCHDLPPYQYNYGTGPPNYYENRISKEIKRRKYLHHDLLGVLQIGSPKDRAVWRNMLRVKDVPWLKDHKLIPNAVLPASGYISMAAEASAQYLGLDGDARKTASFVLRNVSIKSAMQLPEDELGLEVMLSLQVCSTAPEWLEFTISSVVQNPTTWTKHATGMISARPGVPSRNSTRLNVPMDPRVIDVEDWYEKFAEIGLGYGPSFQGLTELLSHPVKNIATAKVNLYTTEGMFKGPESPYIIHPASLDICHQLALISCHGGQTGRIKHAFIPVFIEEMSVRSCEASETWGTGLAAGRLSGLRGAQADVQLFNQSGELRLEINGLRCVAHPGGTKSTAQLPSPYARLVWKPDIASLSFDQAKHLFPPTLPLHAVQSTFDDMDKVSTYMIIDIAQRYNDLVPKEDHLQRLLAWTRRLAVQDLPYAEEARGKTSEDRLSSIEGFCTSLHDVVDVKHTRRIFDNMHDILCGRKSGVEIALQDGLLAEMYASGIGISAAYPQLERLLDLLGHQNPSLKVLEIGAGTGAATQIAMRALGAESSSRRYKSYTFTDVSSAFTQKAEQKFSNCNNVTYRRFDMNKCPIAQGFETDYDLVIASECLHAAKDITIALQNARKLLKDQGKVILIETKRTLLGHGLAYGTFPDYWRGDDGQDSPFMSTEQWAQSLKATGFSGVDIELDDYEAPLGVASTIVTTAVELEPERPISHAQDTVHIVFLHEQGTFHNTLASELSERSLTPVLTKLDSCSLPDKCRVILTIDLESRLADADEHEFEQIKALVRRASSVLYLAHGGLLSGANPKAAIVTGLVRMLITENTLSRYGVFHLEASSEAEDHRMARLIAKCESRIHGGDFEREFAVQDGVLQVSRLLLDRDLNQRYQLMHHSVTGPIEGRLQEHGPMMVDFETLGLFSSLYFRKDWSFEVPLLDDWIEVKTTAIGLNWKNIGAASAKVNLDALSSECSGVITKCGKSVQGLKPGDLVYALAQGKFGNYARFPASHCRSMPTSCDFSPLELASLPIVFCTAIYGLQHLARLRKGERVMIQSASGGLGLAAIQIAKLVGAEIFATVGAEDKAQHLQEVHGIPKERIFTVRDVNATADMMAATSDRGFDVIFSTSTGAMMHETWRCIAPQGRFIDVGRVDVQNSGTLALEIFQRNVSFSSFDLNVLTAQDPELGGELMQEVGRMLDQGLIRPISPVTKFNVSELDQALLYFSRGKHTGKIVISFEDETAQVKMLPPAPRARFDPGAQYVIFGGLGGLGRSVLQWMVDRGARNLTVCSRSGNHPIQATGLIQDLKSLSVNVKFRSCDIGMKASVDEAIRTTAAAGPIKGIIHAAGELNDGLFDTLSFDQWKRGISAKMHGSINLHEATLKYNQPLDFFVMTSSFEAVVALPTQAAYCAANSFQDAFARYRRARGLPACAIAFGLITEVGDVGQTTIARHMILRNGLYKTGELEFLRLLEAAFLDTPVTVGERQSHFDSLAEAQITTGLEPFRLAKLVQQGEDTANPNPPPRWRSDKKFSHLVQSMDDHVFSAKKRPDQRDAQHAAAMSALLKSLDDAMEKGTLDDATRIVSKSIVERTAGLMFLPHESIRTSESIAAYGVDSLIAVEFRNWMILTFESTIPLLKLLDEALSISELAAYIVEERKQKLHV